MLPAPGERSLVGMELDHGKYRVRGLIGRGGMGEVYEAEHTALGHRVAVKVMLDKYTGDHDAATRFTREALAASKIGNEHIIQVIDIGTAPDGRAYVIMELLEGSPLTKVIEGAAAMPAPRATNIIRQVLRAVGAAHAKGIVHRDLKPDNIFLITRGDETDFVKLLDFGISKFLDPELHGAAKLTTTGVGIGTPLYMAPEQAMGNDVDHRADLYACGAILYEMLLGRPPFEASTYAMLVSKLLTTDPPLLNERRPELPTRLVSAAHRALEKDPLRRWDSADAFAAALPLPTSLSASAEELAGTIASGRRHVSSPALTNKRNRAWRSSLTLAVVGVLVGGAVAGGVYTLSRRPGPPPVTAARLPAPAPEAPAAAPAAPSAAPVRPAAVPAETSTPAVTATGTLIVNSRPSGATVFVDGEERGRAQIEIELPVGAHRLRLELAGHVTSERDAEVSATQKATVDIVLEAAARAPGATNRRGPHATAKPRNGAPEATGAATTTGIPTATTPTPTPTPTPAPPTPAPPTPMPPTRPNAASTTPTGPTGPLQPKTNPYDKP